MYTIKPTKKTLDTLWAAFEKYIKQYKFVNIQKHLNITNDQFSNMHQQIDTGGPYNTFDEMYKDFNKAVGTRPNITISKIKYKRTIVLLLAYKRNDICFE